MSLEFLPNEIILDLFEYLSVIDLFHTFFDLNRRFNQLLCLQFHHFHLDLRLLSKTNFHRICQNYIPLILDRIISLHLSNDDDTPQQIELFLSQHSQLRHFTRLQAISLSSLRSSQTLDQIMLECSYLPCLTHLTIADGFIAISESDAQRFFNHIWSLTNLTYCDFDTYFAHENDFSHPTIISTSLRHLIVQKSVCTLFTLTRLCQHTPNLSYLSIHFRDQSHQLELSLSTLSISRLDICFDGSTDILEHLLKNMPNLSRITWQTYRTYIDGYQWEQIIRKYLSKLKIFRFRMSFSSLNNKDKEMQLNEILQPYRTKFWIDEHQWFVRCHGRSLDEQDQLDFIDVFTLPYPFNDFSLDTSCILAKSTCPYDEEYLTCDRVIDLCYESLDFTSSITYCVRFSNIQHLALSLPFDDQFLSVVSKLDRLTSLYIFEKKCQTLNNVESQLQFLLDQALYLRALTFCLWPIFISRAPLMEITSISVRRLDLQECSLDEEWRSLDDKQCVQLSRSPLGIQCETLAIKVKHRRSVLDLVNNMPNLQALNVRCGDDKWTDKNNLVSSGKDELVEWLDQQLPSTCSIMRDTYFVTDIRLWIR